VSVGFAITVVVLWACTACALWPLRRQGPLGTASYLVGMVYNELPVLAIGLAIAPQVLALVGGDLAPAELLARLLLLPVIAGLGWALLVVVRSSDVPEQALTPNQPEYQPGFVDVDTAVTGAIGLYGYYGRTDADLPESSPHAHVNPHAPPFLLVHGDNDSVVPVDWARAFARDLRDASEQPVAYTELPGAQHSFDYFDSLRGRLVVDQIEAFTAWVRSRRRRLNP
jgi:acetyl esterase/lipase